MSTYISQEAQYSNPISPFNFDLLARGLAMKQNAYDASEAELQNEVNSLINLDIAKGVDKEHLNQRVNNLITQINEFGSADLSISSNAQTIKSALKTAIDDNVMNAVASTRSIRNTQAQIEQAKASKDGLYDPANEYVALRGVNEYLSNDQVGQKFQANTYENFTDLNKELKPYMENLQKYVSGIEKQYRGQGDEVGYFVNEKGEQLTAQEVRTTAENLLGTKGRRQLQINGIYNYTQGDGVERVLKPQFQQLKDTALNSLDNQIKNKEIFLNGNATEAEKAEVRKQLDALRDTQTIQKNNFDTMMSNPDIMAYELEKNKFLTGIGDQYDFSKTSRNLSADSTWQSNRDYEFKLMEFEYKKARDKKADEVTEAGILRLSTPTEPDEYVDLQENAYKQVDQARTGITNFVDGKLSDPKLANAKAVWEKEYNELPTSVKTKTSRESFLLGKLEDSKYLTIADKKQVNVYQQQLETKTRAIVEASDKAEQEIADEKLPNAVKSLFDNKSAVFIDPDTGKKTNIVEYLKVNGITENNPENILASNKAVVKRKILTALQANAVIEQESGLAKLWAGVKGGYRGFEKGFNTWVDKALEGEFLNVLTPSLMAQAGVEQAVTEEEYKQTEVAKRRLAIINGEDFASGNTPKTDAYIEQTRSIVSENSNPIALRVLGIGAKQNDVFQSFDTKRQFDKRVGEILANDERVKDSGNFAITPDTPQFQQLMTAVNAGNQKEADKIDKDTDINAKINPDDPSSIIISQRQKDGKTKTIISAPVYLKDVPLVARSMDFTNQRSTYTAQNFTGVKQKVTPLSKDDVNQITDIAENVYMKQGLDVNSALVRTKLNNTKDGILLGISSSAYADVMQDQKYKNLVNTILSDTNLEVEAVKTNIGVSVRVNRKGAPIYTNDEIIPFEDLNETIEKIKYTPMEVINIMIQDILQEKAMYGTENRYESVVSKYK